MTAAAITDGLARWVATAPVLPGVATDPATARLCRRALAAWSAPDALAGKLASELVAPWQPLGRVLVVVSEHDVLGTVGAVLAALATGNQVRVKARTTRPLIEALLAALAPPPGACEVLDWDSRGQDDAVLLADVDAVLIAGGDAAIRHYRAATAPGVRLIEFGPRLGVAAIAGVVDDPTELAQLAAALAHDATVFDAGVCTTPQLVLVEDAATARALAAALLAASLPPLTTEARLLNVVRARELTLRGRLDRSITVALDPTSGWGVTITGSIDPSLRLPRGVALVVGPLAARLDEVARVYRHQRQTLGTWGPVPEAVGYTHRCRLGRMHERALTAPHDGMFELAMLVRFVSREADA
jgi:long-chain-fatty-acyl-CoA reductase